MSQDVDGVQFPCFTVGNPSHPGIDLFNIRHINENTRNTPLVQATEMYGDHRAMVCSVGKVQKRFANEVLIFWQVGIPAGSESHGIDIEGGNVLRRCLLKQNFGYPEIFLVFLLTASPGEQVVIFRNNGRGFSEQLAKLSILLPHRENEHGTVPLGILFETTYTATLLP
jgi:hypothetical protein